MFEYSIEQEAPFIWVDLVGKLIMEDDAKDFMEKTTSLISQHCNTAVINMQHLNYINSSGFNQLLKILSTTRNLGGDTYLCNINKSVDTLLITTKLNTIFTIKQETKNLSDFKKKMSYGS